MACSKDVWFSFVLICANSFSQRFIFWAPCFQADLIITIKSRISIEISFICVDILVYFGRDTHVDGINVVDWHSVYRILYYSCSNKNSNVSRSLVIPVWFQVDTTKGVFSCRKVIVTAGAWINYVLESVGVHVPVYVTQEQVTYLATSHMKHFTKNRYFIIQIHVLLKPDWEVHFSYGY